MLSPEGRTYSNPGPEMSEFAPMQPYDGWTFWSIWFAFPGFHEISMARSSSNIKTTSSTNLIPYNPVSASNFQASAREGAHAPQEPWYYVVTTTKTRPPGIDLLREEMIAACYLVPRFTSYIAAVKKGSLLSRH